MNKPKDMEGGEIRYIAVMNYCRTEEEASTPTETVWGRLHAKSLQRLGSVSPVVRRIKNRNDENNV